MKSWQYLIIQNIKFNYKRFLLFIISVGFGIIAILSVGSFKDTYLWVQDQRLIYNNGTFDFEVIQDKSLTNDYQNIEESVQVQVESIDGTSSIIHVSRFNELLPLHLKQGDFPEKGNEVAVSYYYYRMNGGEELLNSEISLNGQSYTIVGVIEDERGNTYGYGDYFYHKESKDGILYNYVQLKSMKFNDLITEIDSIQQTSENIINTSPRIQQTMHQGNSKWFEVIMSVALIGITIVMIFWIRNMYVLTFNNKKLYQSLRQLGYTQSKIRKMAIIEGSLLTGIAYLFGVLSSYLILNLIFTYTGTAFFGSASAILSIRAVIKPYLLVMAFIAVSIVVIVSTFINSRVILQDREVRNYKEFSQKKNVVKLLSKVYYRKEKFTYFMIQLCLSMTMILLFLTQFYINAQTQFRETKANNMFDISLQVYTQAYEEDSSYDDFLETVNELTHLGTGSYTYSIESSTQLYVNYTQKLKVEVLTYDDLKLEEFGANRLKNNESLLIIDESHDVVDHIKNQQIKLNYGDGDSNTVTYEVINTIYTNQAGNADYQKTFASPTLIITNQQMRDLNKLLDSKEIVDMAKNVRFLFIEEDSYALENILTDFLENTEYDYIINNNAKNYESFKLQANTLMFFSSMILGSMILTAFISLIATLMMQIENRRKDYQLYRTLGMNQKQLLQLIRNEIRSCILSAYIFSVVLSFMTSFLIASVFFKDIAKIIAYPYTTVFLFSVLFLAFYFLASKITLKQIMSKHVIMNERN